MCSTVECDARPLARSLLQTQKKFGTKIASTFASNHKQYQAKVQTNSGRCCLWFLFLYHFRKKLLGIPLYRNGKMRTYRFIWEFLLWNSFIQFVFADKSNGSVAHSLRIFYFIYLYSAGTSNVGLIIYFFCSCLCSFHSSHHADSIFTKLKYQQHLKLI